MLKRQQSMESLARSRGQTIDRLTGENIRLRAEVEELTRALEMVLDMIGPGDKAFYSTSYRESRAVLDKAKGGDRG